MNIISAFISHLGGGLLPYVIIFLVLLHLIVFAYAIYAACIQSPDSGKNETYEAKQFVYKGEKYH